MMAVEWTLCVVEEEVVTEGDKLEKLRNVRKQCREEEYCLSKHDQRIKLASLHAEGDHSGRLLSWLILEEHQRIPVGAIRDINGSLVNMHADINIVFRDYYCDLHEATLEPAPNQRLNSYAD
ncbi:hypothetical protein NDU88_007601 [Pleurodeles waltl]|uniref:Uncharacterized protein n=1 Tax=Pleurodeles waltl TaxID=8319 RepID=A0AAV7QL41_PLEWA|nr:hypothetical protein NDU88_007601 [Pleurodeles waltl]